MFELSAMTRKDIAVLYFHVFSLDHHLINVVTFWLGHGSISFSFCMMLSKTSDSYLRPYCRICDQVN